MIEILFYAVLCAWIGLCGLTLFRPSVAIVLVLSLYSVEQIFYFSLPGVLPPRTVKFATAGAILCSILIGIARGRLKTTEIPRNVFAVAAIFLMAYLSIQWSYEPQFASEKFMEYAPYAIVFWFLAPYCVTQIGELRPLLNLLIAFGGLIFMAYPACQLSGRGIVAEVGSESVVFNPLPIATFASVVLTAAAMSFYGQKNSTISVCLKSLIVCLCLYSIVRGGTRGQFFGIVLTLILWLPLATGTRMSRKVLIPALSAILIAFVGMQLVEIYGRQTSDRWEMESIVSGFNHRLELQQAVMNELASSSAIYWLVGLGYGSCWEIIGGYPHNFVVEVLVELGVIGLVLFCLVQFTAFRQGWSMLRSSRTTPDVRLIVGFALATFTFMFVISLKQGTLLQGDSFFAASMLAWLFQVHRTSLHSVPIGQRLQRKPSLVVGSSE